MTVRAEDNRRTQAPYPARRRTEHVSIVLVQNAEISLAESRRVPQHCLENGLQLAR